MDFDKTKKILKPFIGQQGIESLQKSGVFKRDGRAPLESLDLLLPLLVVPKTILSWLVQNVQALKVGEIKNIDFPSDESITMSITKTDRDLYNADFIQDGKIIHQFSKQTLPMFGTQIMTFGEMYDSFIKDPEKTAATQEVLKATDCLESVKDVAEKNNNDINPLIPVINKLIDALVSNNLARQDVYKQEVPMGATPQQMGLDRQQTSNSIRDAMGMGRTPGMAPPPSPNEPIVGGAMGGSTPATAATVAPPAMGQVSGAFSGSLNQGIGSKIGRLFGKTGKKEVENLGKEPKKVLEPLIKPKDKLRGILLGKAIEKTSTSETKEKTINYKDLKSPPSKVPADPKGGTLDYSKINAISPPDPKGKTINYKDLKSPPSKVPADPKGGTLDYSKINAISKSNLDEIANILKKKENSELGLVHYSKVPGLTHVDPSHMGSGIKGAEFKHGIPEVARSYYYIEGSQPERLVTSSSPVKYRAKLSPDHRIYDIAKDPEGIYAKLKVAAGQKQINPGVVTSDDFLAAVRDAGYYGFRNTTSSLPDVIGLFHKHPVEEEINKNIVDFVRDSRKFPTQSQKRLYDKLRIKTEKIDKKQVNIAKPIEPTPPEPARKSESTFFITEDEILNPCPHCGIPEFKKSETGFHYKPCACFLVTLKKHKAPFVEVCSNKGHFALKFNPNADSDIVEAFLINLKNNITKHRR